MAISTYLPIITLNINGLKSPIKRHRVVKWIKKPRPIYMLLRRDLFQKKKGTHRLKVKGGKNIFHANES